MQNRSRILDAIVKPHDIQTLSTQELEQLSEDCRQRIIEVTSDLQVRLTQDCNKVKSSLEILAAKQTSVNRAAYMQTYQRNVKASSIYALGTSADYY